jgi:hypothetical protein
MLVLQELTKGMANFSAPVYPASFLMCRAIYLLLSSSLSLVGNGSITKYICTYVYKTCRVQLSVNAILLCPLQLPTFNQPKRKRKNNSLATTLYVVLSFSFLNPATVMTQIGFEIISL